MNQSLFLLSTFENILACQRNGDDRRLICANGSCVLFSVNDFYRRSFAAGNKLM